MKNKKIKYILGIVLLGIIVIAIYYFYKQEDKIEENVDNNKVEQVATESSNIRMRNF